MTHNERMNALAQIDKGGVALSAAMEHELEDAGLIYEDGGPYAQLTDEGRRHLSQSQAAGIILDHAGPAGAGA